MRSMGIVLVRGIAWLGLAFVLLAGVMLGCGRAPGQREFDAGLRELAEGRYARARVLFEQSLTERPASEANAWAHNYLGVIAVRQGHLDEAMEHFEESLRLHPSAAEPACNMGALMEEGGYLKEAERYYVSAVKESDVDPAAARVLADFYRRQGRRADARRVLEEALARSPREPALHTALAVLAFEQEGPEGAQALFMKALEVNRDYPPALFNLGLLQERVFQVPEKAAALFQRFLEVEPGGEQAAYAHAAFDVVEPGPLPGDSNRAVVDEPPPPGPAALSFRNLLEAAAAAAAKEDRVKAMEKALEAVRLAEAQGDFAGMEEGLKAAVAYGGNVPQVHMAYGEFLARRGRYEDALSSFKRTLLLDPEQPAALVGLAEAAIETDELDAALVALKRAVRMDPQEPEALWDLAFLYDEHLGLAEQAATTYRDFVRLFPGDPRIIRAQRRLRELAVPVEVAEPAAGTETVEEAQPEASPAGEEPVMAGGPPIVSPEPVREEEAPPPVPTNPTRERDTRAAVQSFNRGTVHQNNGNWGRALFYYKQALQRDPGFVNAHYNLGMVYAATENYDLAIEAYRETLALASAMDDARYNLALVYIEMQRREDAERTLLELVERNPEYAAAHHALGLLYSSQPSTQRKARRHYEAFLELTPDDAAANAVRAWLEQPRG